MDDVDLASELHPAYVAGFFDGEGCVYAAPEAAYIQVEIAQMDRRPLDAIVAIYDGRVRTDSHGLSKWYCPAASSEKFLTDILPYLIVKKRQVELALEFRALLLRGNGCGEWHERAMVAAPERKRLASEICREKKVHLR